MCVDITRGAGGVTIDVCNTAASAFGPIYDTGASLSVPWACSSFTATTITICATASTAADSAIIYNNFQTSSSALFAQYYLQIDLQCQSTGPPALQYDDSVTLVTCQSTAVQLVPCDQAKVQFPNCSCDANVGSTPFTFNTFVTESNYGLVAGKAATLYQFTFVILPGSFPADTLVAKKAEFFLDNSQRSMVLGSVFQGVFSPPSWGSANIGTANSFKLQFGMSGGVTAAVAKTATAGIIIDSSVTLAELSLPTFNQLYYSIFNAGLNYCPTSVVYPNYSG